MTVSKCVSRLLLSILLASAAAVAAADPPVSGCVTYAVTVGSETSYQELCSLPAPEAPSGIWLLQETSRPTPSGDPTALTWWYVGADGRAVRVLAQPQPATDPPEEFPPYLRAHRKPLEFSEPGLLASDPNATQETVSVPAGTFQVLHGTVGGTELFVSDQVPIRGLVRLVADDSQIELQAISTQATNLLPSPAPTPVWGWDQVSELPLGRR